MTHFFGVFGSFLAFYIGYLIADALKAIVSELRALRLDIQIHSRQK